MKEMSIEELNKEIERQELSLPTLENAAKEIIYWLKGFTDAIESTASVEQVKILKEKVTYFYRLT